MTTLNLKKIASGVYQVKSGSITISVNQPCQDNPELSKEWQLVITNENSEDYEVFNQWFSTKKQASIAGAYWVNENL